MDLGLSFANLDRSMTLVTTMLGAQDFGSAWLFILLVTLSSTQPTRAALFVEISHASFSVWGTAETSGQGVECIALMNLVDAGPSCGVQAQRISNKFEQTKVVKGIQRGKGNRTTTSL